MVVAALTFMLRVVSQDDDATWLYLDPRPGSIVQGLRRPDRVNRWALAATSAVPGWRRLGRAVSRRPGSSAPRVLE